MDIYTLNLNLFDNYNILKVVTFKVNIIRESASLMFACYLRFSMYLVQY